MHRERATSEIIQASEIAVWLPQALTVVNLCKFQSKKAGFRVTRDFRDGGHFVIVLALKCAKANPVIEKKLQLLGTLESFELIGIQVHAQNTSPEKATASALPKICLRSVWAQRRMVKPGRGCTTTIRRRTRGNFLFADQP